MSKKTEDQIIELADYCIEISEIACEKCGKSETANTDALEASDHFWARGWRVVKEKCLCKKCAK